MENNESLQRKIYLPTLQADNLKSEFGAIRTFEEVIERPCCSLAYAARERGEETTLDLVAVLIAQFVDSVNVGQNLNKQQIKLLAEDIMQEHRVLKISDLIYFFKLCRRGKYGDLYNSLSPEKLFIWLNQYFDERCEFAASRSIREGERFKDNDIVDLTFTQSKKVNGIFKKVTNRIVKRV